MKDFVRGNQLFSLCGLNCNLCPMFLSKHCLGCGNHNQSCKIAKCSLEHEKIEYCYECKEYPCKKYEGIDEFDSFISHRKQKEHLEKAKTIGIDTYNSEQIEKREILNVLLSNYNDGRKKTFYCVAVNLLELPVLKLLMNNVTTNKDFATWSDTDKCKFMYEAFMEKSKEVDIDFKLRKKKVV
ncbi:MAG: DUF3795 domain-containing protein [Longicatena sp.]